LAHFCKTFLVELDDLFVQVLALAQAMKLVKLEQISLDGTNIKANASKLKVLSYRHENQSAVFQQRHANLAHLDLRASLSSRTCLWSSGANGWAFGAYYRYRTGQGENLTDEINLSHDALAITD
jgi:hypothetical protein